VQNSTALSNRTGNAKGPFIYLFILFIYLLKSTYETNKANDITVGQKGT